MLLEIAIGDAYGAGFEFADPGPDRPNDVTRYIRHALHDMPPGSYTDDTQMTVALAGAMLRTGGELTRGEIADAFVTQFRLDPRLGYAKRFHALLSEIGSGAELLERMRPDSERSGAAMRACPIGLYPDEDAVLSMAELQARITHDTPRGVEAAQAVALATFYCRNALGPREAVGEHLAGVLGRFWAEPHVGPVGDLGVDAARAAVTALSRATSMKGLLADCVDFTGDVDTVAAVAMGMASFCDDLPRDLPAFLERDLENGGWGRGFLVKLDGALLRAFPPAPAAGPTP